MDILYFSLSILMAVVLGVGFGCWFQNRLNTKRVGDAKDLAERIVDEARKEASAQKKELLIKSQEEIYQQKKEMETDFREQEKEIKSRERKLQDLTERLDEKIERVTTKEEEVLHIEKNKLTKKDYLIIKSKSYSLLFWNKKKSYKKFLV